MAENKIHFGLKNVHYAILTESLSAAPSWGTPVAVPGAVNIELSQEGADTNFYADNQVYYRNSVNNGYSGSLELAKIPDQMLKDVWGYGYDNTAKIIFEESDVQPKPFALLFQIEGDQQENLYCFYRCFASRPGTNSETTSEDGASPQTQSIEITVVPVIDPTHGVMEGKVYARTDAATTAQTKAGWFTSVFDDFTA